MIVALQIYIGYYLQGYCAKRGHLGCKSNDARRRDDTLNVNKFSHLNIKNIYMYFRRCG